MFIGAFQKEGRTKISYNTQNIKHLIFITFIGGKLLGSAILGSPTVRTHGVGVTFFLLLCKFCWTYRLWLPTVKTVGQLGLPRRLLTLLLELLSCLLLVQQFQALGLLGRLFPFHWTRFVGRGLKLLVQQKEKSASNTYTFRSRYL